MNNKALVVFTLCGILCGFLPATANAQTGWTSSRPDGHAPIGVMADHTHEAGEFMFSYRAMWMEMNGNRTGTSRVPASEILSPNGENFRIAPLRMPMTMHMFGAMFAPDDRVTLMAMIPVLDLEMDHQTRPGGQFTTRSSGVGDIGVTGLFLLARPGRQSVHAEFGVRLPTGSIEETGVTPASAPNETRLPYPMQTGSGTIDLTPGLTWSAQSDNWSGGSQAKATVRTGENDAGYRLGHRFEATGWVARKLGTRLSVSARLASTHWGEIVGADPSFAGAVAMRMVPTVFTDLRAGDRLDAGAGFNFMFKRESPAQTRFGVEVLVPVWQNLDGPQLETDLRIVTGLQVSF